MKSQVAILLLLIALGFGLANGFSLFFRLAYLLAGLLALGYLWAWANVHWIEAVAERRTGRLEAGEVADERLTVRSKSRLPTLWLEVRDNSDLPGHYGGRVVSLSSWRQQTWRIQTKCRQRGYFTLGPITLTSGDPFGLFKIKRTMGDTHGLLVYPAAVDLPRFRLPTAQLPSEGRLRGHTYYITPNAAGVRDYVPGDSFRRIHWPSTARVGKLMVKEFDLERGSEIWILLDMQRQVQAGAGEESTEEYGVTLAASIAKKYLLANHLVGFISQAERPYLIQMERAGGQLYRILESLAVIKAQGVAPLSELMLNESVRFGRNTSLVIITPSTEMTWVATVQRLTQRGVKACVILVEPSTFGGGDNSLSVVGSLISSGIPTYLVKRGEALETALASPMEEDNAAIIG